MRLTEVIAAHRPESVALQRPAIIAEAGVNHEGSMDIARRLIDEATEAGADAIKFQTYKADTIASRHSPAYWDTSKEPTTSQHELFSKYDAFGPAEYEALKRHCDDAGIEFLSTPFDVDSARYLAPLMDVFKVSSSDLTNLPFIEVMCGYGKPMLLSTGASDLWEIGMAVDRVRAHGNPLVLMHCILNYPTAHENANLGMLLDLRRHFPDAVPGWSDHTVPDPEMRVSVTAALLGAAIIEKHFTHDKTLPGNDHYHAMDRRDLADLNRRLDDEWSILGSFHKAALPSEAPARANARRSLVAARDIPAGTTITPDDLTWKRPAHGISPRVYADVLGRTARVDIAADELLQWRMLD
jgi:N-acetylneuraminate synthase